MTHQLETRFTCDRCKTAIYTPVQNNRQPIPEGWAHFRVDETSMVTHLCKACAEEFKEFMDV